MNFIIECDSVFSILNIFIFYAGNRELNTLTTDEVMSLFTHLKLGNYVDAVAAAALDGEILSNCETEEDIVELVKMERARARSLLKNVKKFKDDKVPPHYLIPLGTLMVLFIINIYIYIYIYIYIGVLGSCSIIFI